ncbi:MAG: 1-deoxy-D-xylulose-5-phosphate synthase, partial [Eggerthellaceae bacterium]|nr:1-deoxy-D-xylulose-5-phosphate synthase [Eggerthellaceae bacterium]
TFLQRAIDQIIVDVGLASCNVVFAIDRAGLVGEDGATHHGLYDLAYLRMIPGMRVLCPSDEAELVHALHTALQLEGPVAVRYPRGAAMGVPIPETPAVLPYGKANIRRRGKKLTILSFGNMLKEALGAAELLAEQGEDARVVDMRWAKPIDPKAVANAARTNLVVTVENGVLAGGAGEAVLGMMAQMNLTTPTLLLGIGDKVVAHGKPDELLHELGLDAEGIANAIIDRLRD